VFAIDGSATEFENFATHGFKGRKIELLLGVVAEIPQRGDAALHAIGADNAAAWIGLGLVLDQQVLAEEVEVVGVEPSPVRVLEPLAQLDVEDLEAQAADGVAVFDGLGQTQPVAADLGVNARLCGANRKGGRLFQEADAGGIPRMNHGPRKLPRGYKGNRPVAGEFSFRLNWGF